MNVLCFGDSITAGTDFDEPDRWPSILQRLLDEFKPGAFHVFNLGMNGNTSAQGFDRLAKDAIPRMPAILVVEFGLNDSTVRDWAEAPRVGGDELKKNLREFHRVATKAGGTCAFIANHIYLKPATRKPEDPIYNPKIREVASALKAPLADLESMMKARRIEIARFVGDDGAHLSAEGNRLYAGMVFDALKAAGVWGAK
ncbi:MAG: SGNH/GDSL hydrolase family protein [Planctomycetota bacterium]